jgi:YD repeat-containing protein
LFFPFAFGVAEAIVIEYDLQRFFHKNPVMEKRGRTTVGYTMKQLLLIAAMPVAVYASAADVQTFRDAQGRVAGTATTNGNSTTYRDARGNVAGTATTHGNTTTYRDRTGNTLGSATASGNSTTYRDRSGNTLGSATASGNSTTYRDRSGNSSGTSTTRGNTTPYQSPLWRTPETRK